MSVATTLSDNVVQHLNGLSFGKINSINDKLALLLEAEYRRRLARYSLTDRQLGQKYQMSYAEFERQRVTNSAAIPGRWNRTRWPGKQRWMASVP